MIEISADGVCTVGRLGFHDRLAADRVRLSFTATSSALTVLGILVSCFGTLLAIHCVSLTNLAKAQNQMTAQGCSLRHWRI